MNDRWNFEYAQTVGRSHLRENPPIPCQDSVLTVEQNGAIVSVLSDGCGSSLSSEIGSNITTKLLSNFLSDSFDEIYELPSLDLKKKIVACVIEGLKYYLSKNPDFVKEYEKKDPGHRERFLKNCPGFQNAGKIYPLTLLDATIQFVAIKENKALIGRLGDGVICAMQNGNLKILSMEDKIGIEANATWYPSTIMIVLENANVNPWVNFELEKIDDVSSYSAFFIMSDGVGDVLIGEDKDENTKFIKPVEMEKVLQTNDLFPLLEDEYKHMRGIFDDLSLAIIKRGDCRVNGIVLREYDGEGKTISNNRIKVISLEEASDEKNLEKPVIEEESQKNPEESQPFPKDEQIDIPFKEKYAKSLKKLIKDDEDKYRRILSISVLIWNYLQIRKEATFDDIVNELNSVEANPDTDLLDVELYSTYWSKIRLFSVNKKNKKVSLRRCLWR